MGKTFVIGDIHGALKALRQVMQRAGPQEGDRLIFLGDYVDGWSESRQVIEYLVELDKIYTCLFLLGNHDAWCEEWLSGWGADLDWLFHGGEATIQSYAGIEPAQKERHLAFFRRLLPYYEEPNPEDLNRENETGRQENEKNRLFIHAGFSSMRGPAMEHHPGNYFWDRTLWETALAVDSRIRKKSKFYPKRLLLYDEIYIGHTPTTNYDIDTPMNRCNVWNIDTGAAFLGKISMMDIDTKEYWQSDVVQRLYPDEKGRNK